MPKEVFQFDCPCCGERIEVNVRSGKARAVDPKQSRKNDLDKLIAEQSAASQRLGSMFQDAKHDQSSHEKKLDRLFDDAAEKAKREPNEKPPNPFDLE